MRYSQLSLIVDVVGRAEKLDRIICCCLFQGGAKKNPAAGHNASHKESDPTFFCSAHKKNRIFLYSKREPEDQGSKKKEVCRDILNEKPSKEDIIAAYAKLVKKLPENAIIYTSFGEIHIRLFVKECPRTTENFIVHSKNKYLY